MGEVGKFPRVCGDEAETLWYLDNGGIRKFAGICFVVRRLGTGGSGTGRRGHRRSGDYRYVVEILRLEY